MQNTTQYWLIILLMRRYVQDDALIYHEFGLCGLQNVRFELI